MLVPREGHEHPQRDEGRHQRRSAIRHKAPATSSLGTLTWGAVRKLIATTRTVLAAAAIWATAASAADTATQAPYVPGELLVKFDGGAERVLDLPLGVGVSAAQQALSAAVRP